MIKSTSPRRAGTLSLTATAPDAPAAPTHPAPAGKTAAILTLMTRDGGASVAELIAVTGWLPHTLRAALTGLRKKGHAIDRGKVDGLTRYMIIPDVTA